MSDAAPLSLVYIGSLDDPGINISAQYNPKELQVDMTVPWQQHQRPNSSGLQYEFTGAQGRTMSIDLLFDGFEQAQSVGGAVAILTQLATVRQPGSSDPEMRRPHHCVATWGNVLGTGDAASFECVITQISTKYTMFSQGGDPLRATVTLKLQEATRVTMASGSDGGSDGGSGSDGGGGGGGDGGGGGGDGGGGGGDGGGDGGGS